MEIRIEKYSPQFEECWNEFNRLAKNGLFLFDTKFLFYHQDRFTDASIIIFDNKNNVIALLPANQNGDTIYSHQGLTYGGLIVSSKVKAKDVYEILKEVCKFYKSLGFEKFIYKAIPYIFHKYPSQEDLYALFRLNARLFRRDISSIIDFKSKIDFSSTKKNLVNRNKSGVIQIAENEDYISFWILLTSVLSKYNSKPVHSLAEIQMLKSKFYNQIRLFTAHKNGKLLAGLLIFDYGKVAHTQYMANSEEGRKLGALDLINFQMINEVFKDKQYYSFGISNENNGYYLNEGLIQQKELMGGRGIVLDTYEIIL